ncbi:MAG: SRPBCC domain-containing protein [Propionibacteriaceae bacterium]|jgi:uncharacterized protein YndB with AHSA1/START domain|nr:SRPBCC domain-containing protein [Propionibacteriaceae bacterium]
MTEQLVEGNNQDTTQISCVVSRPIKHVWAVLLSSQAQTALLGQGGMLGDKGDRWEASDGAWGITRSYHPLEEIRFSWHADADAPRTWVELRLEAMGQDSTRLTISHDHSGVEVDQAALMAHWSEALDQIEGAVL